MFKIAIALLESGWQLARVAWSWLTKEGHWKLAVVALAVILSAYLLHVVRETRKENTELSEKLEAREGEIALLRQAREADAHAAAVTQQAKTEIITREAEGRARTDRALAAHRDWADQPVPADVINSLRP